MSRSFVLQDRLDAADTSLRALGVTDRLSSLRDLAAGGEFRIAVLGRFKAGKSTVVNALLGSDVSPMDSLPCTSQIVEFRGGPLSFRRCQGGEHADCHQEEFTASVGGAAEETAPAGAVRWQVCVPSPSLSPGIVLVDTPGIDEDESRQALADQEAVTADATLIVIRASQAASLTELDLIERVCPSVACLFVVVNKVDELSPQDLDRVLGHLRSKLQEIGVDGSRVFPLAATKARDGSRPDDARLDAIRLALAQEVLEDLSRARRVSIARKLRHETHQLRTDVAAELSRRDTEAERARAIAVETEVLLTRIADPELQPQLKTMEAAVDQELSVVLTNLLPTLLEDFLAKREGWNGHDDRRAEIAQAARSDFDRLFKRMIEVEVWPLLERSIRNFMDVLHDQAMVGPRRISLDRRDVVKRVWEHSAVDGLRRYVGATIDKAAEHRSGPLSRLPWKGGKKKNERIRNRICEEVTSTCADRGALVRAVELIVAASKYAAVDSASVQQNRLRRELRDRMEAEQRNARAAEERCQEGHLNAERFDALMQEALVAVES